MHAKLERRWFAFRLRTLLFVVTVLALPLAWMGYSLNWIRERRDVFTETRFIAVPLIGQPIDAPGGLWLFGESGARVIEQLADEPSQDIERIKRLYPEATFQRASPRIADAKRKIILREAGILPKGNRQP